MENISLYLTIMFWIYMVGLVLQGFLMTFCNFPIKTERSRAYVAFSMAEHVFLLYWLTILRGVV